MTSAEKYLKAIQESGKSSKLEDLYLWPGTPETDTLQNQIKNSVGARDDDVNNPKSRTYKIHKEMKHLLTNKGGHIRVVDICCGDGIVLLELKKSIPEIEGYGIDCNIDKFSTHEACRNAGIHLIKGYLQHVMNPDIARQIGDEKFEFVLMLNTYRGWEYANLREEEKMLPQWADEFFFKYANYSFITASGHQIISLMKKGFDVKILGRGEGVAILIVLTGMHKVNFFRWLRNILYIIFIQPACYLPKRLPYYARVALNKIKGRKP